MFELKSEITPEWGVKSPTYWLAAGGGLFLGFLGINGMLRPGPAADGFGLPIRDPQDYSYVQVKADRDLASSAIIWVLLASKLKNPLRLVLLVSALEPVMDGLLVLFKSKLPGRAKAGRIAIHASALVYILVTVVLMGRSNQQVN